MPLIEHLLELRKRLMVSAVAILVGGIAGWFISDWVLTLLTAPLQSQGKELAKINFPSVTGAFDVRFEIAIIVGIVITSPIWLYQIFAFLTPAFTRKEKKYVFGFFFSAVPLFLGGAAAGAFVIPHIVGLMVGFAPTNTASLLDGKGYLDFALRLILVIGIAFVLPVFLVLLNFVGVLQGRTILKSWRWAILAIVLFTAVATPSADIISMILLAIPMLALYFVAVAIALVHDKRKARRDASVLEGADIL
ncbi:twin-arginine translocase subunit TatC [uncultured Amnibacterium sp.]|uniref:twin-arginine translocase subunit TatC n=1 Tax=uncultured Amnibacterium sp. TaxID=1631851 RepID=UPI0035CCA79E